LDAETRRRERQRALAQALMGAQAPQGQMAGGFYVAPNPLERLATLGSQWAGGRLSRRLDKEDAEAEAAERQRIADTLRRLQGGGEQQGPQMRQASLGGAQPPAQPQDPRQAAAMEAFQSMPLDAQRQVVAGRALETIFPPAPKLREIDRGNEIVQIDEAGRVVNVFPKGATPDAMLSQEGQDRRHLTPSGNARLSNAATLRGQDLSYDAQLRGQDVTMRGQDLSAQTAAERLEFDQSKAGPENDGQKANDYNAAVNAIGRLASTITESGSAGGPIAGTENWFGQTATALGGNLEAKNKFIGDQQQLISTVRRVVNPPGSGTISDYDARQIEANTPQWADTPEVRKRKLQGLLELVALKSGVPLEAAGQAFGDAQQPAQPTGPQLSENAMRYLDVSTTSAGR